MQNELTPVEAAQLLSEMGASLEVDWADWSTGVPGTLVDGKRIYHVNGIAFYLWYPPEEGALQ
jgi:hypothetical protein